MTSLALPYYGGKYTLLPVLLPLFPPHVTFVDVFTGGGSVILSKPLSRVNVLNDVGEVADFFAVLRNHEDELLRVLRYTTFSRDEFNWANNYWREETEPIERARLWYITIAQSFSHEDTGSSGWKVRKQSSGAERFITLVEKLPLIAKRLRQCIIEHLSFELLIPLYDTPTTLFYCDPPYPLDTRSGGSHYSHEMSEQQHTLLLTLLNNIQGQAVLSGYDNPLYRQHLSGWRVRRVPRENKVVNAHTQPTMREECIWIKEHRAGLWNDH